MIKKGSFQTTRGNLQSMLQWISAPLNDKYDKAYLNLQSDELHAVASMGNAVVSYSTFESPFVQDIEIHDSVENGMETIINIDDVEDYVEFVGGETVDVSFYGVEDERGCKKMQIDGDLSVTIFVPSSEADYESQQTGIVNLYNSDDRWVPPSTIDDSADDGEPLPTTFTTDVSEFQRIVTVTEFDDFAMSTYPVVIEDGEFVLNASDDNERNAVSGSLQAEDVEGPDVNNTYSRGFSELFSNINGEIDVAVGDEKPIDIVRKNNASDFTLRYLLLPTE
jgi:hypothetical protein